MSKHNHTQLTLKLGSTMPEHIRMELNRIKHEAKERAEANRRKQRALDRAERYETWQEVQLSSFPIKGRR